MVVVKIICTPFQKKWISFERFRKGKNPKKINDTFLLFCSSLKRVHSPGMRLGA